MVYSIILNVSNGHFLALLSKITNQARSVVGSLFQVLIIICHLRFPLFNFCNIQSLMSPVISQIIEISKLQKVSEIGSGGISFFLIILPLSLIFACRNEDCNFVYVSRESNSPAFHEGEKYSLLFAFK